MKELWRTENPAVQSFVGHLALSCEKPIPQTPWLDQLAPEGEPVPLNNETRRAAAVALGVALPIPVALPLSAAVALPLPVQPLSLDSDPAAPHGEVLQFDRDAERRTPANRSGTKRKLQPNDLKKPSYTPLLIACGAFVLVVGIVAAILLSRGGKPKQDDTAQDDPKPATPKEKDPEPPPVKPKDDDPPVKPKDKELEPIPLRPVGRLEVRERWKHALGVDVPTTRLSVSSDARVVVASANAKIGSVPLDLETGKPLPGAAIKAATAPRGVVPLNGGRFAFPQPSSAVLVPVWDPTAAKMAPGLKPIAFPARTSGLTFVSPNARYLAFGAVAPQNAPAPFKLKDLEADKLILEFDWVRGSALFTADSSRVLVAEGSGRCRWFKLPSGDPDGEEWTFRRPGTGSVGPFDTSADGSVVLFEGPLIDRAEMFHLLDGRNGKVLHSFPGTYLTHRCDLLSADGRLVALCKQEGPKVKALDLIETATGNIVARVFPPAGTNFLSHTLLRDGSAIVAVVVPLTATPPDVAQTVVRYDLYPEGAAPKEPPKVPVTEMAPKWTAAVDSKGFYFYPHISPEFNWIILGNSQGPAAVRDFRTGEPRAGFAGLSRTIDYHPLDKGRLGIRTVDAKDIQVWDLKTGKPAAGQSSIPIPDIGGHPAVAAGSTFSPYKTVKLSPSGRYVVVAWNASFHRPGMDPDLPLRVFDTITGKPVLPLDWRCGSVHFTADSSRLLVAELGGRFRWYTFPLGQLDGEWQYDPPPLGKTHAITDISANGEFLAYAGPGKKGVTPGLAVVSGKTGDVICKLDGDVDDAARLVLSDDGRRVAYPRKVDGKATIEVADAATGAAFALAVVGADSSVPSFALSGDGRVLVVHESKVGKLHLFDVPSPKAP